MTIGGSIFLVALGAILNFAVDKDQVSFVNIHVVGVILMIAGLVGLLIGLFMMANRSRVRPGEPLDREPLN